jgi:biotin synthase
MMGNFLTTLGSEPEDDRAMFEELGLNVARQPDNGINPRPDNRSGWLDGETPDVLKDFLGSSGEPEPGELKIRMWDPSTQLRYQAKQRVPPRPDGARNAVPAGWGD